MFSVEGRPVGAAGPTAAETPAETVAGGRLKLVKAAVLMGLTVVAMTRDVGAETAGRVSVGRTTVLNVGTGRVLNVMGLRVLVVRFRTGSPVGRSAEMFRVGRVGSGGKVRGTPEKPGRVKLKVGNSPTETVPVKVGRVKLAGKVNGRLVALNSGMAVKVALGASGWPT